MLTRRGLTGCALCAVIGFVAEEAVAETPATSGIKRAIITQMEGPVPGYVTILASAEIQPGALVSRHTHPGIESGYAIDGGGVLSVEGQPDKPIAQGEVFQVPVAMPHSFQNGDKTTRLNLTFVVEKGKPLASPA
jgi:quercetin dioxygenase-like cupin family protein